jgi:hypothetical protein
MGYVLLRKAVAHVLCREPEAALEAGGRAVSLIREEALTDRADLMFYLLWANYLSGRFADVVRLIPELEVVARRAGHHAGVRSSRVIQSAYRLNLTGDLRAFLKRMEDLDPTAATRPAQSFVSTATVRLHLGDTERALVQLTRAVAEPTSLFFKGVAEALLFSGMALVGRVEDACALFGDVEPRLPAANRRNIMAAWAVLDAAVPGLMLADDVGRCGDLYPLCTTYLGTGVIADCTAACWSTIRIPMNRHAPAR